MANSLFAWLGFSGPSQAVFRLDDVDGLVEADRQAFLRLFPIPSAPLDPPNAKLVSWINVGRPAVNALVLDGADGVVAADRQTFLRLYRLLPAPPVSGNSFNGRTRFSWLGLRGPGQINYVMDGVAGLTKLDRKHWLGQYRLAAAGTGGGTFTGRKRFSWLGMRGPGQVVYAMDGVSGLIAQDRIHWLGMYRREVTAPTGRPYGAYVRFTRLGAR